MRKKRRIIGLIILVGIALTLAKGVEILVTYKNGFNLNVHNTMIQIISHSNGVSNYSKGLLEGEYTKNNVFKLRSNYDEFLQDVQQLNISAFRFNEDKGIDISKITRDINGVLDFNDLEQRNPLILSKEEINSLTELNKNCTEISNIIEKNIKDLPRDTWGTPNILNNETWIKIIDEINE